jgi:aspartate racemase
MRGSCRRWAACTPPRLVLHSFDFHEIERLQHAGDWDRLAECLSLAARNLEGAGADFLLICTNTMHKVAPAVEAAVSIPLLHIADATAAVLRADGAETVGLLGTAFTMEQDFYRGRLSHHHGYPVLVPGPEDRQTVHRVIYEELCKGKLLPGSRQRFVEIIQELADRGAQAVILGCTEIGLLVSPDDTPIPLVDTTRIHAEQAVKWALGP